LSTTGGTKKRRRRKRDKLEKPSEVLKVPLLVIRLGGEQADSTSGKRMDKLTTESLNWERRADCHNIERKKGFADWEASNYGDPRKHFSRR